MFMIMTIKAKRGQCRTKMAAIDAAALGPFLNKKAVLSQR